MYIFVYFVCFLLFFHCRSSNRIVAQDFVPLKFSSFDLNAPIN
jgi:hypothetical protein